MHCVLRNEKTVRLSRSKVTTKRHSQLRCYSRDKDQYEREKSLDNFRKGRGNVLVATDVAARGLDIPGVAMVLIYDFPGAVEDYVHRIGRTGRAGKTVSRTLYSLKKIRNKRESWYRLWKVRTKRCLQSYKL